MSPRPDYKPSQEELNVLKSFNNQSRSNRITESRFYKCWDLDALRKKFKEVRIDISGTRLDLIERILAARCNSCKKMFKEESPVQRCRSCKLIGVHKTCVDFKIDEHHEWLCYGCMIDNYKCSTCEASTDDVMQCEGCEVMFSCLKCVGLTKPPRTDESWYCSTCSTINGHTDRYGLLNKSSSSTPKKSSSSSSTSTSSNNNAKQQLTNNSSNKISSSKSESRGNDTSKGGYKRTIHQTRSSSSSMVTKPKYDAKNYYTTIITDGRKREITIPRRQTPFTWSKIYNNRI